MTCSPLPRPVRLTLVIPCYNEEKTLRKCIDRVLKIRDENLSLELVIVDDGSRDRSLAIARELALEHPEIVVVPHEVNQGKGAALRTGFQKASGEFVGVQDADLEYDPNDFVRMIEPIREGRTKVVYGTRYGDPENIPRLYFANYVATRLLTRMANLLYGIHITDESTCYKAFHVDAIRSVKLRCKRFEFCPEVTAKIAKKGHKVVEVPISYRGRTKEEGKKIGWRDGVEAIWTLLKYRFVN